jgi:hypothetical protein
MNLRTRRTILAPALVLAATAAGAWSALAQSAAPPPDYRQLEPLKLAAHLEELLEQPRMAEVSYWRSKPPLAATLAYSLQPRLTASERQAVRRFKRGHFRPNAVFPWKPLAVPPPWGADPSQSSTYDFYRHSLRWMVPLVEQWSCEGDNECLQLVQRTIASWIQANSRPPGASRYAWYDHACSYRTRVFCWFWELWRRSDALHRDSARLLLASIYQHATYLADDRNYHPTSNHALHMDASLLAAALTFPEFKAAEHWQATANRRLAAYARGNFAPEGFHLEQSPSYHWYVLERIGETLAFLRENREPAPPILGEAMTHGLAAWPYLIRPDGAVPNIGDSDHYALRTWRKRAARFMGCEPPQPAASTLPNPRGDGASFLVSFKAGYAVFTSYPISCSSPQTDTYALFRCNAWQHSAHCHCDALSFELFGLGREWLVDSGKFNYQPQSPERQYMRSSRAHNVVLVDDKDFRFHPVKLLAHGRTNVEDFVQVCHELPRARHVRRFSFRPPRRIRLTDELEAVDGNAHTFTQLLHVAPGLKVGIVSAREVCLRAADGDRCVIEQLGDAGDWAVVEGQKTPFHQGWYSRCFNEMEPAPVLRFTRRDPSRRCTFVTRISLHGD